MTTWDPSDKGANISLSGGNLIATATGSSGATDQFVITSTSKSSGKSVLRLTGDLSDGGVFGTYNQGGITLGSTSLEGNDTDSYHLYQSGDEFDLRYNGGRVAFEYPYSSFPTPADGSGDVLDVYLDLDNDLLYFKLNGTFLLNSEAADPDPTVPVGGIPIAHGTYFVYREIYTNGVSLTLDPSPTGLPSGWSAWDAGGGGVSAAAGSSAAVAAASGVGRSTAAASGSAAATAAATAVGRGIVSATGTASASAAATGVGRSTRAGSGASAATAAASGVGRATASSPGASAAAASAAAVGRSTASSSGSSAATAAPARRA
jgi:hypothetical protein